MAYLGTVPVSSGMPAGVTHSLASHNAELHDSAVQVLQHKNSLQHNQHDHHLALEGDTRDAAHGRETNSHGIWHDAHGMRTGN